MGAKIRFGKFRNESRNSAVPSEVKTTGKKKFQALTQKRKPYNIQTCSSCVVRVSNVKKAKDPENTSGARRWGTVFQLTGKRLLTSANGRCEDSTHQRTQVNLFDQWLVTYCLPIATPCQLIVNRHMIYLIQLHSSTTSDNPHRRPHVFKRYLLQMESSWTESNFDNNSHRQIWNTMKKLCGVSSIIWRSIYSLLHHE